MIKKELDTLRYLTNFWSVITAIVFLINFFNILNLAESIKIVSIVYVGVLSIFTASKEYSRWREKTFISNHYGELFIFIWTVLLLTFIMFNIVDANKYYIPSELTATYLSVLGVFAISRKSRSLKKLSKKK